MDSLIDSLVLYTLENGSLTWYVTMELRKDIYLTAPIFIVCSIATVLSMVCWLAASYNRVFLGLHFMIGKCEWIIVMICVVKYLMFVYKCMPIPYWLPSTLASSFVHADRTAPATMHYP